jgi:hypothetical protein
LLPIYGLTAVGGVVTVYATSFITGGLTGILNFLVGTYYAKKIEDGVYNFAVDSYRYVIKKLETIIPLIKNEIFKAYTRFKQSINDELNMWWDKNEFVENAIIQMLKLSDISRVLKVYNKSFLLQKNFTTDKRKEILEKMIYKLVYITCNSFVFTIPSHEFEDSEIFIKFKKLFNQIKPKYIDSTKLSIIIDNKIKSDIIDGELYTNIEELLTKLNELTELISQFEIDYNNFIKEFQKDALSNQDALISERKKLIKIIDKDYIVEYHKSIMELKNESFENRGQYSIIFDKEFPGLLNQWPGTTFD